MAGRVSTGCGSSVEPLVLLQSRSREAQIDYVECAGRPRLRMLAEGWDETVAGSEVA
jgi:hypothetical protein